MNLQPLIETIRTAFGHSVILGVLIFALVIGFIATIMLIVHVRTYALAPADAKAFSMLFGVGAGIIAIISIALAFVLW